MNEAKSLSDWIKKSISVLQDAMSANLEKEMNRAIDASVSALSSGGYILVCGNGGSAADASHIVGELVGRFMLERRPYRAICLASNSSVLTAWSNDYDFDTVFSRQVEAYADGNSVLIGLSTSGNSTNVCRAFEVAREKGMTTIGFTGEGGGKLKNHSDVLLAAPTPSTPLIQQVHICLYHHYCAELERRLTAAGL
ncbi:D-sedoheptulose-7-phosphate isomerase [Desulfosediminicola sp.]|uniref:D-sedoheptulose-7-phosphate isomerase n=1 Tax=Desulfosediminicola sp. TaxID=2886825 RepID=UPI003AF21652